MKQRALCESCIYYSVDFFTDENHTENYCEVTDDCCFACPTDCPHYHGYTHALIDWHSGFVYNYFGKIDDLVINNMQELLNWGHYPQIVTADIADALIAIRNVEIWYESTNDLPF